jgi:hypothetical protein
MEDYMKPRKPRKSMKPKSMVKMNFYLTREQKEALDQMSMESGESIAMHIRRCIKVGLERIKKEGK